MKKYIICILIFLCGLSSTAENIVQMKPFKTTAGVVSSKSNVIEIELSNSDDTYAIQFSIYLPEGMSLPQRSSGSLYTTLDEEVEDDLEFTCASSYNSTDNYYTVMVYTTTSNVIPKGGCTVLTIRYTTDSNMEDGVYPIIFKQTKIETGDHQQIVVPETSSYIIIGDSKSPSTSAHVDLSGMTGYIPSFVVNQLNTDIASNKSLKSLNLSGTSFENLGAALIVPDNKDLLWYTSDKASLNRTFTAGNWSTVCLPFTLETITVNTLLTNGCAVKGMTSYDPGQQKVTFDDVNTMSTGVPYLFKCSDLKTKPFENIDITNPEAISTGPHNVTVNNLTFKGTYELDEPSSTGLITIYGYKDNQFVKVKSGQSGKVQPFRAYMELADGVGTRGFISIDGLDDATGINEIVVPDAEKPTPIYDLQGRKVDGNYHSRGILIQNGKKIIKK